MASVYDLKPRFQSVLRPWVDGLAASGTTANQVTLAAFALTALAGLLIWVTSGHWLVLLLVPLVQFARMALNAVDGMLAREHHQASDTGMFLNELTDVAGDAVLYLPFMVIAGTSSVLLALVVTVGILVEMAGVLAPMIGASRRYDGPFGKSDRAVAFGLLAVFIAFGLSPVWVNLALAVMLVLGTWTIVRRCRAAMHEVG